MTALSKPIRCAICTRVSTDAGLDQEFNSLDAQYDAASAYIRSHAHARWTLVRTRYDDGGFSGGSTGRPALQQYIGNQDGSTLQRSATGCRAAARREWVRLEEFTCLRRRP